MKKTLLLAAALACSGAAQAETWVCSTPTNYGGSYLSTYVRQDGEFSYTITTPATQEEESRILELGPLEILVETDVMLTLAKIDLDGTEVAITMINKITKQQVGDSISFHGDISRSEGSCIMI